MTDGGDESPASRRVIDVVVCRVREECTVACENFVTFLPFTSLSKIQTLLGRIVFSIFCYSVHVLLAHANGIEQRHNYRLGRTGRRSLGRIGEQPCCEIDKYQCGASNDSAELKLFSPYRGGPIGSGIGWRMGGLARR